MFVELWACLIQEERNQRAGYYRLLDGQQNKTIAWIRYRNSSSYNYAPGGLKNAQMRLEKNGFRHACY